MITGRSIYDVFNCTINLIESRGPLAIILLYVRQNRLLALDSQQKRRVTEMEELMSAYMAELKEENDTFLRSLANDVPADVESVTEPHPWFEKRQWTLISRPRQLTRRINPMQRNPI
ncbi:hypothetical protein ACPJHQ_11710 [Rossellomorea sp. H39__3]